MSKKESKEEEEAYEKDERDEEDEEYKLSINSYDPIFHAWTNHLFEPNPLHNLPK